MPPLRALLVTAALAATAAAAAAAASGAERKEDAVHARYFPGLPTPLAPFIDFYETHLEPEDFVTLRGVAGHWAFVLMAVLVLGNNMGILPLNPADYKSEDDEKIKPFMKPFGPPVRVKNGFFNQVRSISNQLDAQPLTMRLPSCLPLLLCSMERSGWTVPLQPADAQPIEAQPATISAPSQRPKTSVPEGPPSGPPTGREDAVSAQSLTSASGDPCRRFRAVCAVPVLQDFL